LRQGEAEAAPLSGVIARGINVKHREQWFIFPVLPLPMFDFPESAVARSEYIPLAYFLAVFIFEAGVLHVDHISRVYSVHFAGAYPPDLRDAAVQNVLQQADALAAEWGSMSKDKRDLPCEHTAVSLAAGDHH
jgi:hypothetical protein